MHNWAEIVAVIHHMTTQRVSRVLAGNSSRIWEHRGYLEVLAGSSSRIWEATNRGTLLLVVLLKGLCQKKRLIFFWINDWGVRSNTKTPYLLSVCTHIYVSSWHSIPCSVTGSEIFRGSAEFRGFSRKFGHSWDQWKSGEKRARLYGGGVILGTTWPTRMVHLPKFSEFYEEITWNMS